MHKLSTHASSATFTRAGSELLVRADILRAKQVWLRLFATEVFSCETSKSLYSELCSGWVSTSWKRAAHVRRFPDSAMRFTSCFQPYPDAISVCILT